MEDDSILRSEVSNELRTRDCDGVSMEGFGRRERSLSLNVKPTDLVEERACADVCVTGLSFFASALICGFVCVYTKHIGSCMWGCCVCSWFVCTCVVCMYAHVMYCMYVRTCGVCVRWMFWGGERAVMFVS